ncbi:hypothetical protein K443DRAFT_676398 [Laccaria amethystina LaAM-08-1]|uniref:Uncharacterized protein n=1 Tax=Laccaria amethystina LaAM-08-1 TaxID=1095629 RepID=A0A0C9Y1I0_9AGAR|nr:hypothetical protein K443DRAFT_676398 [Laccaria amethystina LaAM-08-1]
MLKQLLTRFGMISPPKIYFYGLCHVEMTTLARTVECGRYYQHSERVQGFKFAEIRLEIDGEPLDAYIPSDTFGSFLFTRENLPETPGGIVFVIDTTDAESMHESRRELISLVHDTKKLSQPILILVSTANTDVVAECDLEEIIAEENGRIALFTYSLPSNRFIEGFRWLVKKMEM